MRLRDIFITSILALTLFVPFGHEGLQKAEAQIPGIPGLGGGGGNPVRIVADVAPSTIINTLKTALIEISTAFTGMEIASMNLKETVLDPIAWNMAKQLQQQLTGNLLKWLGGQLPGQNSQVPFVQNYGEHYESLADAVAGEFISGNRISGLCSPEENFKATEQVYYAHVQSRSESEGEIFQCSDDNNNDPEDSDLDRMFQSMMTCSDATCAGFKAKYKMAIVQVNAFDNENRVLDYSRGMKVQKVCREVGGSASSTKCGYVSPAFLSSDSVSFQLAELPGLQMLQTDEFNEVVSNLMSNLTNQAMTGLTGVLGLSGNPQYSANVFGDGGNLSYVDALLADDISRYQTATANPITAALKAARDYRTMLDKILADIKGLEDKLAADTAEFAPCFDLTLTPDLIQAKSNATSSLSVASTSIVILATLDQQYASSTNASERGAIMSTFIGYKNQNLFRTEYENQQFRITYLEFTFAQWVDKFKYDTAVERQSCGGSWDYVGVLPPPTATSTRPDSP